MSLQALRTWPILDFLDPEFIANIHMIIVYGSQGDNALIVTKDQEVYGVGSNSSGCLGTGTTYSSVNPVKVKDLCGKNIKTISCGSAHVLATTEGGKLYAWGSNAHGQLGNGHHSEMIVPASLLDKVALKDVACGNRHSLALTNTGEVYAWGDNTLSQVWCSESRAISLPTIVFKKMGKEQAASISCSYSSSFIVTQCGEVYSWGSNQFRELGLGTTGRAQSPCLVDGLDGVAIVKIACGYGHVLALSDEGFLYVWGLNEHGQLGIGYQKNMLTPCELFLPDSERVLDVAAHYSTNISVAMGERNRVFIWGECLGLAITKPTLTTEVDVRSGLARYTLARVMHQPFILDPEQKTSVSNIVKEAFNDPASSDLTIKVHGKSIHVHRTILQLRCQHFRNMFKDHWMESKGNVIENDEFSFNVYTAFLKYLYTDEVHVSPEDSLELFDLANSYCEPELKKRSLQVLKQGIKVANVLYLYGAAVAYENKELQEFCFAFALRHMTEVVQTPFFADMDKKLMKDFIIQAAARDAFKT